MNDPGIPVIIGVVAGVYIWWSMTKAAWKNEEPYFNIMKALAVTFLVAPIAAMFGSMIVTYVASQVFN